MYMILLCISQYFEIIKRLYNYFVHPTFAAVPPIRCRATDVLPLAALSRGHCVDTSGAPPGGETNSPRRREVCSRAIRTRLTAPQLPRTRPCRGICGCGYTFSSGAGKLERTRLLGAVRSFDRVGATLRRTPSLIRCGR